MGPTRVYPQAFLVQAFLVLLLGCRSNESKAPDIAPDPIENVAPTSTPSEASTLDLYGDPLPEKATGRLGSLRMVDRSIRQMIFTFDGRQAISTHRDGFQLWDLTDASRVSVLEHEAPGDLMAVTSDGKRLATSVDDADKVVFWDLESGNTVATLGTQPGLIGMCYLNTTTFITASASGTITTWDLSKKDGAKEVFQGPWKNAHVLGCSPKSGWLAIGTLAGEAYALKSGTTKPVKLGVAKKAITSVAITSDGSAFAFGSADENIYLWQTPATNQPFGPPNTFQAHDRLVVNLAFTSDNRKLFSTGGDWWFRIWDPKTGDMLEEMPGIEGLESQLMALSPDGNLMLSWSQHSRERGSEAGRWWLWNSTSGAKLLEPKRHSQALTSIAFSPDGSKIATSSEDSTVRLWNAKSTASLTQLDGAKAGVHDVEWSSDGAHIYSAGTDALLNRWTWGSDSRRVVVEGVGGAVNRFVLSRDGSRAYTGDQIGRVWSWDVASGSQIQAYDRQGYSAIYDIAISRDDRLLAIAGSDASIRIIDLNGGKEVAQLNPGRSSSNFALSFSPDGKVLASGGDGHKIQLWSTTDWNRIKTLDGHDGTVRCLAFSPDGKHLASGGNDELVRLWNVDTGEESASYSGHQGVIADIAFSPDGKRLASASRDRTALIWTVSP